MIPHSPVVNWYHQGNSRILSSTNTTGHHDYILTQQPILLKFGVPKDGSGREVIRTLLQDHLWPGQLCIQPILHNRLIF